MNCFLRALGLSTLGIGAAGFPVPSDLLHQLSAQQSTEADDLRQDKRKTAMSAKVFAANLWFLFDLGPASERYNNFLANGIPSFKMFIESILLHDQIVIPTQDFMVLQLLRSQLPERDLFEMLEADYIRFMRFEGMLAYSGGQLGHGIQPFAISDEGAIKPDGKLDDSKRLPFSASLESAVEWGISVNKEKPKDSKLASLVLEKTDEITAKSVVAQIRHETYMDVLESNYLSSLFALRNRNMNRLARLKFNQVRASKRHYAPTWQGDEIDVVLALAQTNLELYLAQASGCVDSSTASPVGHVIKAKAQRTFADKSPFQDFAAFKEIADIPDIGDGVLQKNISVKRLLKLRQSTNGEQFRRWFHENCRDNPTRTAKELFSLVSEVPGVQHVAIKVLRFIVTSLLPWPFAPIGGAIDSFVIDRMFRGSSPKYFIEDLRQLHGKPQWRRS